MSVLTYRSQYRSRNHGDNVLQPFQCSGHVNDRKVDVVEEGFDVALRIGHLKDSSLVTTKNSTNPMEEYEPEPLGLCAVYAHRKLVVPKVRAFLDFLGPYFGDAP
ncbi:hypothetical protein [Aestuariibacter sp. A3R04]|uniref:hypothetical protein n=1 Tax=Aestuariibacter sp. A3R04 TaxID=2841571 RepID=UPI001C0A3C20|nr:hypothetical protein [Aestuariibacter sp. A3R04]MBU3021303.1 hypothetical protein [Aestuariibacter sp. A3R04]